MRPPFTIYVAPALTERRMGLWWEMVEDIVTRRDWLVYLTEQGKVSLDCSTREGQAGGRAAPSGTSYHPRGGTGSAAWLAELVAPGRSGDARSRCPRS